MSLPMSFDLKGARVLITAGASGIGLATARAFAQEGYGSRAIAGACGSGNLRGIPRDITRIRCGHRRRQQGNQASEQESSKSSLHGASSRLAPRSGTRVTNLTSRQV